MPELKVPLRHLHGLEICSTDGSGPPLFLGRALRAQQAGARNIPPRGPPADREKSAAQRFGHAALRGTLSRQGSSTLGLGARAGTAGR